MECDKCMDKNKEHELLIKQSHKRSWRGSIDLRVLVKRERRILFFAFTNLQSLEEVWKPESPTGHLDFFGQSFKSNPPLLLALTHNAALWVRVGNRGGLDLKLRPK